MIHLGNTMTNYRQLCSELVDAYAWCVDNYMSANSHDDSLVQRARAALAEPEPAGPTDEELDELLTEIDQSGEPESWRAYARAVLARWGNHPGSPDSSTQSS
jgi:hypothetical protein